MNFHNITYLAKFIVDYDVETYNKQNNEKSFFEFPSICIKTVQSF